MTDMNADKTSENITPNVPSTFRPINAAEIAILESLGCRATDWTKVTVEEPFAAACYRNVTFAGDIALGSAGAMVEPVAGIPCRSGIYNAAIADSSVGRNVYINNVAGGLRNLDIEDDVIINSVYSIICKAPCCFGNDVTVNVMSETGGREVNITCELSAPIAYIQAFYRHSLQLQRALTDLAAKEADRKKSSRAKIAKGSMVADCGEITDVAILGKSQLKGVAKLTNGTIRNAFVGRNVIAEDFIILDDATVDSGASLHGAFVGQAATVCAGFTAHDTLIFANSHLENGESAATFAGPFTTSMHKSTLLIGGLFSFYNAGSATNQSNHMYKLGPMHYGITGRGCKTGSGSYILWPAVYAPFTTIIGHHTQHLDTRDFPFSYIFGSESRDEASTVYPGAAINSVGLARDVVKWQARDKRSGNGYPLLDPLHFYWLSPYTMQGVLNGIKQLQENTFSLSINPSWVQKGIQNYQLLVDLFAGGILRRKIISLISTNPEATHQQVIAMLREEPAADGNDSWVDMVGMMAPRTMVDAITNKVIDGEYQDMRQLNRALTDLAEQYYKLSWSWTWQNFNAMTGATPSELTPEIVCQVLSKGADAADMLEAGFIKDAAKELDYGKASLGFGIDANNNVDESRNDFSHVRGSVDQNRFLAELHRQVMVFTSSCRNIIKVLES
jgi:hypothetical protein